MNQIRKVFPQFVVTHEFIYHVGVVDEEEEEYDNVHDNEGEEGRFYEKERTYEKYFGSYAQDEMGYSDDDIDTIFDGDPSAYWNID